MMQWGNYGWGMEFGWLFMAIFWILIILGLVYLIKLIAGGEKRATERRPSTYSKKIREW